MRSSTSVEQKRAHLRSKYAKVRQEVLAKYGNACLQCGFNDPRALQLDHINGGGSQDRKINRPNSMVYYRWILKEDTTGFQLLCANCNWIKRAEKNENRRPE